VVADGQPSVIGEKDLLIQGANDVAREQSKRENRRDVEEEILGAAADDEEVDLLTALDLGVVTTSVVDGVANWFKEETSGRRCGC
jgi:hypothetical protein